MAGSEDSSKAMKSMSPSPEPDMSAEEFRQVGHRVIDWIADYIKHSDRYPVLSRVEPGAIRHALPKAPPLDGQSMADILSDIDRVIVPGVTHWNHPGFLAYFSSSGSGPGILGEMFTAAFNANAMLWRTCPSATELEQVTIEWLRQMLGLDEGFSGVIYDTASISNLCAIGAARESVAGFNVREDGLVSADNGKPARLRLYASEQAHSSVDKAAMTLGIGQRGIRKIGTDIAYRLNVSELERAIAEDREAGWRPFCVVATVGTTATTSIDPVREIGSICRREGLWLHVDAAYGGSAAVIPEMKWIFEGSDQADSIVVNPHKWLFVPLDLSVLFCRRMNALKQAFSLVPEYLRTEEEAVPNFMDYGPQLGRRFRAIKLWFVMRYFGTEGLAERLRKHIELAREFASWVERSPDFELLAPVPFSTVCFRAVPRRVQTHSNEAGLADDLNERLLDEVNREGKVFLSQTRLDGRIALRLAIGNIRTTAETVELAWEQVNTALKKAAG